MESVLLVLFLVALSVVLYSVVQQARQESRLHRLCSRLRTGRYRRLYGPGRWWHREKIYQYESEFRNRRISVRYNCPSVFPHTTSRNTGWKRGELEIEIPVMQKFWLRLLTEHHASPTADEIQIGDEALDNHYLIHTNVPEAASEFLLSPDVRKHFSALAYLFSRMEVYKGRWKILFPANVVERMTSHDMERVMDALEQLAHSYELHLPLRIMAVPKSALCPYCRSELNSGSEKVLVCSQCGTSIHEACWEENGQCTTWGCTSGRKGPTMENRITPPQRTT